MRQGAFPGHFGEAAHVPKVLMTARKAAWVPWEPQDPGSWTVRGRAQVPTICTRFIILHSIPPVNTIVAKGLKRIDQKSIDQRFLAQVVVAPGEAIVAGAHVRHQKQAVGIGLERPEPGHPLGRVPVGNLEVVQARPDQDVRIVLGLHVLVDGALPSRTAELTGIL